MREETALWLTPLMEAWPAGEFINDLMIQSLIPIDDVPPGPHTALMQQVDTYGDEHAGIDWIRFGQLIRERLGWNDYPLVPDSSGSGPTNPAA
jgi:hypothetical protein